MQNKEGRYIICPECGDGVRQVTTFFTITSGNILFDSHDICVNYDPYEGRVINCQWYMKYQRQRYVGEL